MEKANVVLVVLNKAALEISVRSLNFAVANLVAIVVEDGNDQDLNIGERSIPLVSFAYVHRLIDADKNFLWLISGHAGNFGDLWKFKKFLTNSGVPQDNIVNFELMVSVEWIANLRYVEEHGADFFATGISYTEVGLDLRYIPHSFGRGVNLAGSNQDLRQGYLTAKYVFEHVKPGTIKFVLIGLTPYSLRYSNAESFSVCSRNLQYMLALNVKEETVHDRLLKNLVGDNVKNLFIAVKAEHADLNFNRTKNFLNGDIPAKTLIDWEAELDNVTKKLRPQVIEKNLSILEDYIKLCLQHGAKPVGVIFPFAPIIRKNFDKNLLMSFRSAIRRLQESYDFTCADLFDLKLGYDCFYNTAHLNLRGAAAASTLLSLHLHEQKLLPKETFCDMNYEYFNLLSILLPKDKYNALMARVFDMSAQMIRGKDKIKIGFVLYDSSMWSGDELYNYFARDEKFEPTVFLCLRTDQGDKETVKKDFLHGVEQFKSRGLNVVPVAEINAAVPAQDVLIFLTPYFEVMPDAFRLSQLTARTLLAFIMYGFVITKYDISESKIMRVPWKIFFESIPQLELFKIKCRTGMPRGLYSGYPRLDVFFDANHDFHFDWKMTRPDAKKIIWAPHWSIGDGIRFSTFQWNYQFMYEFARAHPETSWVVKPHPNLLFSAVKTGVFPSMEAFEAYLKAWNDLPNAQVYTGAYYQALFATSDGMIHDSGSFTAEYQYVDKPMIYLTRDTQKFNELGEKILSASYRVDGRNLNAISAAIQKIFIEGNDPLKDARRKIFDEYLNYYKRNGMMASEFVFKSIADELKCVRSEKIFGGDIVSNPSVSIIVPVYKAERYIKQCVDSILAQTFQDFEIILVDDASPDDSFALCRKLYGDNDKIKILRHEKNLCQGAARNTGMKHARGKYVYFVDSDDLLLPDALEKFFNTAEKTGADVVHATGWYALYQDEPAPVRPEDLEAGGDDYTREGFLSTDLLYRLDEHWTKYRTYSMVWMCFCRRDFLQENGIEFLPMFTTEDDIFHFALLFCARRYYVLPATLYVYRRHKDSLMFTRNAEHLAKCIPSVARGAAYIKILLDSIPHFERYEQWCAEIVNAYIGRFVSAQTLGYYADLTLSPEASAAANVAFEKLFGEYAPFVSNLFNGYHIFFCQGKILEQQVQSLREEIQRLKGEHRAEKRILLLGTPAYGDLGDLATVAGELRVLKDYFPDREVIEVPYDDLTGGLNFAKNVRRDDLIFMHGGNLGNRRLNEEQLRRALIETFPDNKIVLFPQSIDFTDDDGRRELARSQQIYNAHDDLHLMTRDEVSFDFAQEFFPRVNNYLLPDAAIALHGMLDDVDVAREGVLFVLRGDKVRDDAKFQVLQESFADTGIPFAVVDTVINEQVTANTRDEKIRAALLKIRQSKLVVTENFNGMMFAFVTRTPVLAFKSLDTKISSGVKWFENFPSVFCAEDTNWDAVETFINLAFDDAAVFAELNPDVKIDGEALFFDALNQIIDANTLQMSQAAKKFQ